MSKKTTKSRYPKAWEMRRLDYINQQPTWMKEAIGNGHEIEVRQAIKRGDIDSHPDYPQINNEPT